MAQQTCLGTMLEETVDANIQRMKHLDDNGLHDLKLPKDALPPGVIRAFDACFLCYRGPYQFLNTRHAHWNDESAMSALIKMVDTTYFCDQVRSEVPITLNELDPNKKGGTREEWEGGVRKLWIQLDVRKHHSFWDFFGTLIHEMAHAYIQLYQCHCGSAKCAEKQMAIMEIGVTGHGVFWQRLTLQVEKLTREIRGKRINLGREKGASHELKMADDTITALRFLRTSFGDARGDEIHLEWYGNI